jgi:hypothetical protein
VAPSPLQVRDGVYADLAFPDSSTEAGPDGPAGDKRVILAIVGGGFCGPDASMASFDHAGSYPRIPSVALKF